MTSSILKIVKGNDFTLNMTLSQYNAETESWDNYSLDTATDIDLYLVTQQGKRIKLDAIVEDNKLTANVLANYLQTTIYGIEITFNVDGKHKRTYEAGLIKIVNTSREADMGTCSYESNDSYHLNITTTADTNYISFGELPGLDKFATKDDVENLNSKYETLKFKVDVSPKLDSANIFEKTQSVMDKGTYSFIKLNAESVPPMVDIANSVWGEYTQYQMHKIIDKGNDGTEHTIWLNRLSSVYTQDEMNNLLNGKANVDDVYTNSEVDILIAGTEAQFEDYYTKEETEQAINNHVPDLTGYKKVVDIADILIQSLYDETVDLSEEDSHTLEEVCNNGWMITKGNLSLEYDYFDNIMQVWDTQGYMYEFDFTAKTVNQTKDTPWASQTNTYTKTETEALVNNTAETLVPKTDFNTFMESVDTNMDLKISQALETAIPDLSVYATQDDIQSVNNAVSDIEAQFGNYYTTTDIDAKLGDIDTILSNILG